MFIRSSTAINDCLIALDQIKRIGKDSFPCLNGKKIIIGFRYPPEKQALIRNHPSLEIDFKESGIEHYIYCSEEARDKAYEELCSFLNSNYKLRDFT